MDSKTETVSDKAMIDAFMGYAKPENNKRYDTAELLAEAITRILWKTQGIFAVHSS